MIMENTETVTPGIVQNTTYFQSPYSETILGLTGVSCILSVFGACVIFWTFWFLPEIRNFTRKLIVSLTIADLISALGYLMSVLRYAVDKNLNYTYTEATRNLCTGQSIITTYSSIVSFLLTCLISVHLLVIVNYPDYLRRSADWTKVFNTIGWGVPLIITLIAAAEDVLGEDEPDIGATGPWCWVKPKHETKYVVWMFVAGKGWEISCYLLSTMLYICMKYYHYRKNRQIRFEVLHRDLREDDKNFLYVFFVLYIIRLWGTVRFFMIITGVDTPVGTKFMTVFLYMQAIGDPAQAFCNFFLFCVCDNEVRRKVSARVRRHDSRELVEQNERSALIT